MASILEKDIKFRNITASVVLYDTDFNKINMLIKSVEKQSTDFNISLYIIDYSFAAKYKNRFKSSSIQIYYYSQKNRGFGSGHNYAFKVSKASEFHVFLNPDITFNKNLFFELSKHLDQNKQCVACSPIIRNIDNSYQLSGRQTPTFFTLFFRRFSPNSLITQMDNVNDLNQFFDFEKCYINSPSVSGAFIFIRKNIFTLLNGFDERYFMYMEDFDLSKRLHHYGEIHYIKKISLKHHYARGSYYKFNLLYHHIVSFFKFKIKFFFQKLKDLEKIKKKKIFIISTSPFIIDNFFKDHIALLRRKHNVIIFTNFNEFKEIKLNFDYLSAVNINISRNIKILNDIICFFKLLFVFLLYRPNMVISLGPKAGIISGMASFFAFIKIRIFIFQGVVWSNKSGLYRKFLMFFDFLISKFNNKILSISAQEKNFLVQNKILSKNKVEVLGHGSICGVNKNYLSKNNHDFLRQKLDLKHVFIFCYIGRLNHDKGILDLIEAYINLKLKCKKRIALLLIGPDEMSLNKKILDFQEDSIKIFPYQKDLKPFYRLADCLVLPSYREGLPITILESFASNLPVIVSNIPSLKALVSNKRGLSFEVQNVKSLQSKMNKMLNDSHLRNDIKINAYQYVAKNFDEKIVVNNYINYFESLLNE